LQHKKGESVDASPFFYLLRKKEKKQIFLRNANMVINFSCAICDENVTDGLTFFNFMYYIQKFLFGIVTKC